MNLVIDIVSHRKYRNAKEWRNVSHVTCPEFRIARTGDGAYIADICKEALDLGCEPDRLVEVRRGETVCFKLAPVRTWAYPPDRRPEHLK